MAVPESDPDPELAGIPADDEDEMVVLVVDPLTGAADAYGPYPRARARADAAERRRELDREGLDEVTVVLVPHHRPR